MSCTVDGYEDLWRLAFCQDEMLSPLKESVSYLVVLGAVLKVKVSD